MKIKNSVLLSALAGVSILIFSSAITDNNGIAGYSGSPGEKNCTNCHTGTALNAGGGSLTIGSNIPATGYVAGTTYQMTVEIVQSGVKIFGFDLEALQSANANAGTLVVTNSTETQLRTSGGKSNIIHKKFTSATTGSHTFSFNWTAPAATTGDVTFYAAGNAANGDNKETTGDKIYTSTLKVSPASLAAVDPSDANSILAVYPNPVKDKLTVQYQVKTSGTVNISLFDSKGNEVETLLSEEQASGLQQGNFSINKAHNAGIYFLKIKTRDGVQAQMVVIE